MIIVSGECHEYWRCVRFHSAEHSASINSVEILSAAVRFSLLGKREHRPRSHLHAGKLVTFPALLQCATSETETVARPVSPRRSQSRRPHAASCLDGGITPRTRIEINLCPEHRDPLQ